MVGGEGGQFSCYVVVNFVLVIGMVVQVEVFVVVGGVVVFLDYVLVVGVLVQYDGGILIVDVILQQQVIVALVVFVGKVYVVEIGEGGVLCWFYIVLYVLFD